MIRMILARSSGVIFIFVVLLLEGDEQLLESRIDAHQQADDVVRQCANRAAGRPRRDRADRSYART
jgi:hypothetical protein